MIDFHFKVEEKVAELDKKCQTLESEHDEAEARLALVNTKLTEAESHRDEIDRSHKELLAREKLEGPKIERLERELEKLLEERDSKEEELDKV